MINFVTFFHPYLHLTFTSQKLVLLLTALGTSSVDVFVCPSICFRVLSRLNRCVTVFKFWGKGDQSENSICLQLGCLCI